MLNGLLFGVVVLRGIFLRIILFFVVLGDFEQENLLQISPNLACDQKHTTIMTII